MATHTGVFAPGGPAASFCIARVRCGVACGGTAFDRTLRRECDVGVYRIIPLARRPRIRAADGGATSCRARLRVGARAAANEVQRDKRVRKVLGPTQIHAPTMRAGCVRVDSVPGRCVLGVPSLLRQPAPLLSRYSNNRESSSRLQPPPYPASRRQRRAPAPALRRPVRLRRCARLGVAARRGSSAPARTDSRR